MVNSPGQRSIHSTERQRAHPESAGFEERGRHIGGEDGSLCGGKPHSPDFAFHISRFFLAPEGLSSLSPVSKNLPAGGGGIGKEYLISGFHRQISTELTGCVF